MVVGVISSEHTLVHLSAAPEKSFDIAELRVDLFGVDSEGWLAHAQELEAAGIPVILTVRHKREGGHWYRDERERAAVYRRALPFVSAVDVEIRGECFAEIAGAARDLGKVVIGSFHDFEGTPEDSELARVAREGWAGGASIIKIAAFLHSDADEARLKNLLTVFPDGNLCLLGMGPRGPQTRIDYPLAGSCLSYGFVDQSSAPGQLSAAKLCERLAEASPEYGNWRRQRG